MDLSTVSRELRSRSAQGSLYSAARGFPWPWWWSSCVLALTMPPSLPTPSLVIAFRDAELRAELQWNRLLGALAFADQACNGDLINRVLEVQVGGECLLQIIPPEPNS